MPGGGVDFDPLDACGEGVLPICVCWLAGTVTFDWQAGQANTCPAAVSSTVSCVLQVGHGNLRSIRALGQMYNPNTKMILTQ